MVISYTPLIVSASSLRSLSSSTTDAKSSISTKVIPTTSSAFTIDKSAKLNTTRSIPKLPYQSVALIDNSKDYSSIYTSFTNSIMLNSSSLNNIQVNNTNFIKKKYVQTGNKSNKLSAGAITGITLGVFSLVVFVVMVIFKYLSAPKNHVERKLKGDINY